jgi:ERCC4-related helicase
VDVRLEPKCLILSGFMPPRERMLALSSFQGDFLLMTAIALNNDYILGRIKMDSFDIVVFDEAHRVVAQGEELGQYRYSVNYKQLALNLTTSKKNVALGLRVTYINGGTTVRRRPSTFKGLKLAYQTLPVQN